MRNFILLMFFIYITLDYSEKNPETIEVLYNQAILTREMKFPLLLIPKKRFSQQKITTAYHRPHIVVRSQVLKNQHRKYPLKQPLS